ncbi:MAG TPA: phosphate acyltransferase PlsX [Bacillales bacterium]|nr:phosphate acyltransferase PlsX [Bacillales bacterium]
MRIAVDAMGGDHAPKAIVSGAEQALATFGDLEIALIGDENQIRPYLSATSRAEIIHTNEVIGPNDSPVKAVRAKKDASMVIAAREVSQKKADACISAGNTGALVAAGLFLVGRMKGISRPGLAPTLPTTDGKGFLLIDVGANADAKAEHLYHYALMGSIYVEKVRGIQRPRVGLLNIGTEEGKGNRLSQEAFSLLEQAPVNFVGNVEARGLMEGAADVVVCDGFSGNLVLKSIEGTAMTVMSLLKRELTRTTIRKVAAAVLKPGLKGLKNTMDYSEYGGAGLFGLAAPVVKAHGSSDGRAIFNAIRQAREIVSRDVTAKIAETVQKKEGETNE